MKNKALFIMVLLFGSYAYRMQSRPTVTFFIRPWPSLVQSSNETPEYILKKMREPGKIARKILKLIIKTKIQPGIFATYGGYMASTDTNGQVTFPLMQEKPLLNLIITNHIKPTLMTQNTVHHWEIGLTAQAAMYTVEKKQDEISRLYFWNVQKKQLPKNKRIPMNTIVVMAKPKNMYVPTGIAIANENPQLILPDIYAKKGVNILPNALYALPIRHFFNHVGKQYQEEEEEKKHLSIQLDE